MFRNREPRPREADWTTEDLQHIFLPSQHLDDGRNQADDHHQFRTPPQNPFLPMQTDAVSTEGSRALNSAPVRNQRKRRDRKLDLTKCDRCRFDKQKCTPTSRVWPAKCDRCAKKGFPCSEGRRIERPTRFDAPVSRIPEPTQNTEDESIDSNVKDWLFLVDYRRLILAGLDDLADLGAKTCLLSAVRPRKQSIVELLSLTSILQAFDQEIDSRGAELIDKFHSSKDGRAQILSHIARLPLSTSRPAHECYLCSRKFIQRIEEYEERDLDSRLFETRIFSLVNLAKSGCMLHSFLYFTSELDRLCSMANLMSNKATNLISKSCSSLSELLIPVQALRVGRFSDFWDGLHYSLSARSKSHTLLDMYMHLDINPSLGWLEEIWGRDPGFDINQQDFLGRTVLYIACQMPWLDPVRLILKKGAKTNLPTIYGTLPIHAAAAIGRKDICKLLIQYGSKSDLEHRDDAGLQAVDFAIDDSVELILFGGREERDEEDDHEDQEESAESIDEDDSIEHANEFQRSPAGMTYDPPIESRERPQEPLNSGNIESGSSIFQNANSAILPRNQTATEGSVSESNITRALVKVCRYCIQRGYAHLPALGDLYWKLAGLIGYIPEDSRELIAEDEFEESIMLCITAVMDIPSLNAWVQSDPDGTRDFEHYVSCITSISGLMGFTSRDDQALKATLRSAWQYEAALGRRIRQRLREMNS